MQAVVARDAASFRLLSSLQHQNNLHSVRLPPYAQRTALFQNVKTHTPTSRASRMTTADYVKHKIEPLGRKGRPKLQAVEYSERCFSRTEQRSVGAESGGPQKKRAQNRSGFTHTPRRLGGLAAADRLVLGVFEARHWFPRSPALRTPGATKPSRA